MCVQLFFQYIPRAGFAAKLFIDNSIWPIAQLQGELMLDTTEVNYSFGKLHDVMRSVLGKLKERRYPFDQVLILGYGGGSAAQIIHDEINPEAQIVGVELDSEVVALTEI